MIRMFGIQVFGFSMLLYLYLCQQHTLIIV